MKRVITILIALIVLGGIGTGAWWFFVRDAAPASSYRTAAVKRGELLATISATGTVVPEEVVDVGAQVAGQILSFGPDPAGNGKRVDYGTQVEEGTLLAQIDDSVYAADVASAKAAVEQQKANVRRAEADIVQMKAKLYQTDRDWQRAQKIGPSDALSQNDYDLFQANYEAARANLTVAEASVDQAKSGVEQAEATLKKAQRNLDYCTIESPVKGVVIARRVGIGQTVVSSFNTPSLFLLAKDLKRMQIWAPVNEADIGSIAAGQQVTFTVDAYPGQTFKGEVVKIRLDATITQSVVTYTVEVVADNSAGKLLPYMTASVSFEVSRRKDVLQVPNAALRWAPRPEQIAPEARDAYAASQQQAAGPRRGGGAGGGPGGASGTGGGAPPGANPGRGAADPAAAPAGPSAAGEPTTREAREPRGGGGTGGGSGRSTRGTVWLQDGDFVRPVSVRIGLTDNSMTEVQGEGLTEGAAVVVGESRPDAAGAGGANAPVTNPFAPQFPQRRRGG